MGANSNYKQFGCCHFPIMFNSVFEILPNAIVLNDADAESVTEGVL